MSLLSNSGKAIIRNWFIGLSILQVLFIIWVPDAGYDKYFWQDWTKQILTDGLGGIYLNPEVNNQPLNLYLLKVLSWTFSDASLIDATSINRLKLLTFPFNLLSIGLILYLLVVVGFDHKETFWLLLNPAFWYNTVVWGQVDVVFTFFCFVALILAERRYWQWAWLAFLVAVNFKLQAVVIGPLLLVLTYQDIGKAEWSKKITGLWILVAAQTAILIPFILSGNLTETIAAMTSRSVDQFPVVARKAYNVWHYFFADPFNTPDSVKVLGIPMKLWGLVLFGVAASMNMSLLSLAVMNRAFDNLMRWQRLVTIFQVAALVYLAFFLFNTQMHERYVHPALLFAFIPFAMGRDKLVYILVSIGYILNMEAVMRMFRYYDQAVFGSDLAYESMMIFNPMFIASIFLFAYLWGTFVHAKQFLGLKNSILETVVTT